MTDIVIANVPEHVLAVIDANAEFHGVSRTEYLHRLLAQQRDTRPPAARASESTAAAEGCTSEEILEGLRRIAEMCADALDPEIMARAWR